MMCIGGGGMHTYVAIDILNPIKRRKIPQPPLKYETNGKKTGGKQSILRTRKPSNYTTRYVKGRDCRQSTCGRPGSPSTLIVWSLLEGKETRSSWPAKEVAAEERASSISKSRRVRTILHHSYIAFPAPSTKKSHRQCVPIKLKHPRNPAFSY